MGLVAWKNALMHTYTLIAWTNTALAATYAPAPRPRAPPARPPPTQPRSCLGLIELFTISKYGVDFWRVGYTTLEELAAEDDWYNYDSTLDYWCSWDWNGSSTPPWCSSTMQAATAFMSITMTFSFFCAIYGLARGCVLNVQCCRECCTDDDCCCSMRPSACLWTFGQVVLLSSAMLAKVLAEQVHRDSDGWEDSSGEVYGVSELGTSYTLATVIQVLAGVGALDAALLYKALQAHEDELAAARGSPGGGSAAAVGNPNYKANVTAQRQERAVKATTTILRAAGASAAADEVTRRLEANVRMFDNATKHRRMEDDDHHVGIPMGAVVTAEPEPVAVAHAVVMDNPMGQLPTPDGAHDDVPVAIAVAPEARPPVPETVQIQCVCGLIVTVRTAAMGPTMCGQCGMPVQYNGPRP